MQIRKFKSVGSKDFFAKKIVASLKKNYGNLENWIVGEIFWSMEKNQLWITQVLWLLEGSVTANVHSKHWKPEGGGGSIAQWLAHLLPDPAAPGSIARIPEFFSEKKIVNVTEVNQKRCLEEIGQCLENVEPAHVVLASG